MADLLDNYDLSTTDENISLNNSNNQNQFEDEDNENYVKKINKD